MTYVRALLLYKVCNKDVDLTCIHMAPTLNKTRDMSMDEYDVGIARLDVYRYEQSIGCHSHPRHVLTALLESYATEYISFHIVNG